MSNQVNKSNIIKFNKHFVQAGGNFLPDTRYNEIGIRSTSKPNLLRSYNSIVYSAVQLNANAVSDVEWNVFRETASGIVDENQSPEAILLRSVNPLMNNTTLFFLTQAWIETAGCAFWWMKRNEQGRIEAIWPLSPANITINNIRGFSEIDFFTFTNNGRSFQIPVNEVIRFFTPNLSEPYLNTFSPLQAIWREKALWDEELLNALALMQNHARPDAMITPKGFDGIVGDEERKAFERQLLNKFKRGGAGGLFVAAEALDYTPLAFTSKDAELLARKKVTKNDIANAFSVPLALLESENINRATLEAAMFQHGFYAIKPRIKVFQETLNEFYFPMFGRELKIKFENPVPIDREREAKLETDDLKNAVITINEVREKRGLEAVSWGDEPYIPVNLIQPSARIEINTGGSSHASGHTEEDEKQNAKTLQDAYQAFIKYRTGKADYAMLARVCRSAEIDQDRLNKWCKEITPMKYLPLHAHAGDEKKMIEWKALNDIPTHKPLQKIFRDTFSDQEQDILKALSKAAKGFDGVIIKAFPDDAVEFLDLIGLNGWEEMTAERARPQIEIDTGKGIDKTNKTIVTAGLGDRQLPEGFVGSKSVQDAISKQVIPLSESTVATTRQSLAGAVKALKKELAEGLIEEGEALPSMVKRVQAIFTNAKRHRAESIAITESNKAFNNGTLESAKQSNVVTALRWVLSPEPCIICETIAGKNPQVQGTPEVPVGSKFTNPDAFFGDIEAPPAHVNCACTIETVLIDFEPTAVAIAIPVQN